MYHRGNANKNTAGMFFVAVMRLVYWRPVDVFKILMHILLKYVYKKINVYIFVKKQ